MNDIELGDESTYTFALAFSPQSPAEGSDGANSAWPP